MTDQQVPEPGKRAHGGHPTPPELPAALRMLARVVETLCRLAMAIAAIAILVSLCLIGYAVVMRYFFNNAPVWVDDLVGFALVLIVLLSAGQVQRNGEHIGVDILIARLSPRAQQLARVWGALAAIIVGLILIINGWETVALAQMLGLVTEGTLEWPTWWLMMLMPAGGVLIVLAALESGWRAWINAERPGAHHDFEEIE